MGFLGMGYTKDGKGVSKDDAEKNGFFMFFELFGRKFVKFLKLNMLYFAVSIPYLIILFFVSMKVVSFSEIFSMTETIKAQQALGLDALMRLTFITLVFVFWGAGPAAAGFAYTLRNYAREEHALIFLFFSQQIKLMLKRPYQQKHVRRYRLQNQVRPIVEEYRHPIPYVQVGSIQTTAIQQEI